MAKGIRALFSMIKMLSKSTVVTATLYVNILKITELCISRGINYIELYTSNGRTIKCVILSQ